MRREFKTVVPRDSRATSIGTALVLLASLVTGFAILALFMTHHHTWTDSIMAKLPLPGPAASFAADPSLSQQLRFRDQRAWNTMLADQTPTLVAEATLVNDALIPVRNVVVFAEAMAGGRAVATMIVPCGKAISNRLLGRIGRDELRTVRDLAPNRAVAPGQSLPCQVAFAGVEPGTEEVRLTIASAEPLPGHLPPSFHPLN